MKKRSGWHECVVVVVGALTTAVVTAAPAQEGYVPTPENLKALAWFQEARFGLFIHWGVYAGPGEGEWVMQIFRQPLATPR